MESGLALTDEKQTRVRYLIVCILFIVSSFSFGDRVALSLAGAAMPSTADLSPVRLGYLFSGFSWAYVLGQLPSGGLLDRFGSRWVYGLGIIAWTIFAILTGAAGSPARRLSVYRNLSPSPALRIRAITGFPRQRARRRILVSDFRARARFGHFQ